MIPKHARKVYDGTMFQVYEWEQELFDGTTKTFEGITRVPASFVIPVLGDKILMIKEEQPGRTPFVFFPGGKFDDVHDDPLGVAVRELREETGYQSDDIKLWKEFSSKDFMIKTDYVYVARQCHKIEQPSPEGGERIEPFLVSFDELFVWARNSLFRMQDIALHLIRIDEDETQKEAFKKLLFN